MPKLLQDCPEILSGVQFDSDRYYPLSPDLWPVGGHKIHLADEFDTNYFGRGTIRISTGQTIIPALAIKVYVTGAPIWTRTHGTSKVRVKVEFLKDGEESEYTGGWLYFLR